MSFTTFLRRWRQSAAANLPGRRLPLLPRLESLECRLAPTIFTVTTTADSCAGSLRQAILDADSTSGPARSPSPSRMRGSTVTVVSTIA
jgi:hypothetical protein